MRGMDYPVEHVVNAWPPDHPNYSAIGYDPKRPDVTARVVFSESGEMQVEGVAVRRFEESVNVRWQTEWGEAGAWLHERDVRTRS